MIVARPATCMQHLCFCEAIRPDGIRQPANSASSLAFVIVAAAVLVRGKNRMIASLFAITLAFVGIGSAWFHATLSFTGQFFDVLGMYLIATLALLLSIDKLARLRASAMVALYLGMNAILALLLYTRPEMRRWIFGLLLIAIIITELKGRGREKYNLIKAIVIMTVAFIIWIIDFTKMACAPMSIVQGHALWHILGAIAAWYLYLHYDHVTRIRQ
jgi:hypothetical protein